MKGHLLSDAEQMMVGQLLSEPSYGRLTYEEAIKRLCGELQRMREQWDKREPQAILK